MAVRQDPEVLVVGAGPVGLFAGLALAQRGIQVQIIDKMSRTGVHSYALALHGRALGLLRPYGLLDKILAQAYPIRTVGLFDQARPASGGLHWLRLNMACPRWWCCRRTL